MAIRKELTGFRVRLAYPVAKTRSSPFCAGSAAGRVARNAGKGCFPSVAYIISLAPQYKNKGNVARQREKSVGWGCSQISGVWMSKFELNGFRARLAPARFS